MSLCLFPCLQTKGKYQPPTFRMAWGPRGLFCTTICNVHRIVPLDSLWTWGMHCRRASWWFLETMFLFNGFNHLQEPKHCPVILSCSWFPRPSACLAWTPGNSLSALSPVYKLKGEHNAAGLRCILILYSEPSLWLQS